MPQIVYPEDVICVNIGLRYNYFQKAEPGVEVKVDKVIILSKKELINSIFLLLILVG